MYNIMIPYVILVTFPDYKRSYFDKDYGVVKKEEMHTYFLDRICDFVLDRIDIESLHCLQDVASFFNLHYDDTYMFNLPWEAHVFIDNEWVNVTPSNETIWEHIQLLKLKDNYDNQKK